METFPIWKKNHNPNTYATTPPLHEWQIHIPIRESKPFPLNLQINMLDPIALLYQALLYFPRDHNWAHSRQHNLAPTKTTHSGLKHVYTLSRHNQDNTFWIKTRYTYWGGPYSLTQWCTQWCILNTHTTIYLCTRGTKYQKTRTKQRVISKFSSWALD